MRRYLLILALLVFPGCNFIGGGETVVSGDDNVIENDTTRERVAMLFSRFDAVPEVADEDLVAMYGLVREKAMAGDLDAILVVLRLAEFQRMPREDESNDG